MSSCPYPELPAEPLVLLGLLLYRLVLHDMGRHSMYLLTLASYLDVIRMALVSEGRRKPRFMVEGMDRKAANLLAQPVMSTFVPGQFRSR